MFDEQDAEYLAKIAEKVIAESKGVPVNQLTEHDIAKWEGVNIQGHGVEEPDKSEDTLALYMVDCDRQLVKRFTVTNAVLMLAGRKTTQIIYGTTDVDGRQIKTIIKWEKEKRTPIAMEALEGESRIRERKDLPDT